MKLVNKYIKNDKENLANGKQELKIINDKNVSINQIVKFIRKNFNDTDTFDTHNICNKNTIVKATRKEVNNKFANEHVYTDNAKTINKKAYELAKQLDNNHYYYIDYNIEMICNYSIDDINKHNIIDFVPVTKQLLKKLVNYSIVCEKKELDSDIKEAYREHHFSKKPEKIRKQEEKKMDINNLPF